MIATGNDVAALQAAIDGAVPGGVVCLESGDHSVEETIFVYGSVHVLGLDGAHLTQTFVGDLFEVSATDVTIENLGMTGANRDRTGEECSGTTAIRDWGSVNLSIVDNAIDTFTCGIQINDTDGFEISGNEVSNIGYTGIGTFPAFHGTIEGNVVEDVNPGGMLDECAYGIVTSGLATVSSAITVTGNTVDQARTWECFDNHDGNAIDFLGNTCIAPGRVGINVVNAGVAEPTGRVEGNTIDAAGITAQWNSIYHGGPGTVLNNIIIGFGSEPCRVQAPLATVSGNTCQ